MAASGRARRQEYWLFFLVSLITVAALIAVGDLCHLTPASPDDKSMANDQEARSRIGNLASDLLLRVGGTGIEPVTPSVSGKCSPAELTAREAEAGIEPAYRALQALA
jgi:hypothetical protein